MDRQLRPAHDERPTPDLHASSSGRSTVGVEARAARVSWGHRRVRLPSRGPNTITYRVLSVEQTNSRIGVQMNVRKFRTCEDLAADLVPTTRRMVDRAPIAHRKRCSAPLPIPAVRAGRRGDLSPSRIIRRVGRR